MRPFFNAWSIGGLLSLAILSGAITFYFSSAKPTPEIVKEISEAPQPASREIGTSVEGRKITAYTYGTGPTHLVFAGGIHGGYEWNSVVLAYQLMDYLDANPQEVPNNLRITVIPNLNPDGVFKIVGKEGRFAESDVPEGDSSAGRFNAHGVDLNRNFDCKWKPTGTWRDQTVSAGTGPFSEPEAKAIRDFTLHNKPAAFVFWHSQANAAYASQCEGGILLKTLEILDIYSSASKYPAVKSFDAYEVNGASEDWLASIGIPAITVEMSTHEAIEWEKNLAGVKALIANLSQK